MLPSNLCKMSSSRIRNYTNHYGRQLLLSSLTTRQSHSLLQINNNRIRLSYYYSSSTRLEHFTNTKNDKAINPTATDSAPTPTIDNTSGPLPLFVKPGYGLESNISHDHDHDHHDHDHDSHDHDHHPIKVDSHKHTHDDHPIQADSLDHEHHDHHDHDHHHDHHDHDDDDKDDSDELEMEQEEMFVDAYEGFEFKNIREWGGPRRGGRLLEPTRYGDWERKGRCSDF